MIKKEDPRTIRAREKYVGREYVTNQGYEVAVIEFKNKKEVTIIFKIDKSIVSNLQIVNIKKGTVRFRYHHAKSKITFAKKSNILGDSFFTNEGYEVIVINHESYENIEVMFSTGYVVKVQLGQLHLGNIKNPYHPSVLGVGYFGVGKYKAKKDGKTTMEYTVWSGMLQRCYNEKIRYKNPTYKDCYVDNQWHNFQIFCEWFCKNHIDGWHLDKDILFDGNKIYSPATCCFIPQEINNIFTTRISAPIKFLQGVNYYEENGLYKAQISINNKKTHLGYFKTEEEAFKEYKKAKEYHIKMLANKWKGLITDECYNAMCEYRITKKASN